MVKLRNLSKSIRRDERGNIAMFTAFCLIPAVCFIGGAIDLGLALKVKGQLKSSADAGVLAAAALGYDATSDQRTLTATDIFNANMVSNNINGIVPKVSVSGSTVSLTASASVPTNFLKLMKINTFDFTTTSVAAPSYNSTSAAGAKICLLALDPASTDGIHIQGDNAINYSGCWAHTNSSQSTAINSDGNSSYAVGDGHCAVGNWVDSHDRFSPEPQGGCATVPDPFAKVSAYASGQTYTPTFTPPATDGSCKSSNLNLKKGTYTLDPGRYCGGIDIQAQATVTFNPGIYIIDGGELTVQSGANVSGTDVLFYFNGDAATATIIGGGTISLKGRLTSSTYAGFLFIAKPGASTTQVTNIQGGGTFKMEGVLYMPKQRIEVSGNGDVNGSTPYFGMIAKDFYFRGNGAFKLKKNASGSSLPDILPTMPTTQTLGRVTLK